MVNGYFSLVLHTHMPYVRKNGGFPVGEDWLFQAISDTYIPLLGTLAQLEHEGIDSCMALTLTPVLCEQLGDPYIKERTLDYFRIMIKHTEEDIEEFERAGDLVRMELAKSYLDDFQRRMKAYAAINGDILGALRYFEESGMIETIGSTATHAFLPALETWASVESQILIGIHSHRLHMGIDPKGFWLPECAYRNGIEDILDRVGVEYIILDNTALPGLPGDYPCYIGDSNVIALKRNGSAHLNVWSQEEGYPADGSYLDSIKRHHNSGLYYWKVTNRTVPIEDKELYIPEKAMAKALEHCEDFIESIREEIGKSLQGAEQAKSDRVPPLIVAGYDTELFGHAWREGIYWIETALRSLAASDSIRMALPSQYIEKYPPAVFASPLLTTWGDNNDDSTWINPETAWIWKNLKRALDRFQPLNDKYSSSENKGEQRALNQAARELLLLESSDWPFMVAKDRAKKYATERFNNHLERFDFVVSALEKGNLDMIFQQLETIEETDNIFQGSGWDINSFFR